MKNGFTIIELVMVLLLAAILAAVAVPNFIDFRADAKNGATHEALGVLRSALMIATATIQLKEDPTNPTPKFPTLAEMQSNAFDDSHPALRGTPILDAKTGIPRNPWSPKTVSPEEAAKIFDCGARPQILKTPEAQGRGWCYSETTGEIWANSNLNQAGPDKTENTY